MSAGATLLFAAWRLRIPSLNPCKRSVHNRACMPVLEEMAVGFLLVGRNPTSPNLTVPRRFDRPSAHLEAGDHFSIR